MYTEIHNGSHISQKSLYFKLNNVLNLWNESEENVKITGIYAIYKDDICVYVGQSKNIASRLATHIKGKYSVATNIFIFDIKDIGFSDYEDRKPESKVSILNNCENWFISKLKPIENIIANMTFSLPSNQTPNIDCESFSISIDEFSIKIANNEDTEIQIELDRMCHFEKLNEYNDLFPKSILHFYDFDEVVL